MLKTYFVVAEMQNHIDKLKDSWLVDARHEGAAFEMAKNSIRDTAKKGEHWVIVKFERVE